VFARPGHPLSAGVMARLLLDYAADLSLEAFSQG
jgi:hypothetical protein